MEVTLLIQDPAEIIALDRLQIRTKAKSIGEVVGKALALYDLATENQKEGGKLIFQNKDGSSEDLKFQ